MKLFLCALGMDAEVFIGIPSSCVAEIILEKRSPAMPVETESSGVYISLPVLFGRPTLAVFHGMILKGRLPRTVLLVPPIDTDEEIPDGRIHPLPELLRGMLPAVGGACFAGDLRGDHGRLILPLNPGLLFETIDSLLQGVSHD